jgi:hypothetical protein
MSATDSAGVLAHGSADGDQALVSHQVNVAYSQAESFRNQEAYEEAAAAYEECLRLVRSLHEKLYLFKAPPVCLRG